MKTIVPFNIIRDRPNPYCEEIKVLFPLGIEPLALIPQLDPPDSALAQESLTQQL